MKLLTNVLPTSVAISVIFLLTGCTKHLDVDKYAGEFKYCPIQKMISKFAGFDNRLDSSTSEIDFFYNKAGNPDSIICPFIPYRPIFYYFRYDRQNRLTDYQIAYSATNDPVVWHRYSYPRNGEIVDSQYAYGDTPRSASHPSVSTSEISVVTDHLDGRGRVVKTTVTDASGTVSTLGAYDYDARGDLILPGTTYDDKINPIQTNSVWMLLGLNYSVHNAVAYNGTPFAVFTYDPYGLPTTKIRQPNSPYYANNINFLAQFDGDYTSISYGCDVGHD